MARCRNNASGGERNVFFKPVMASTWRDLWHHCALCGTGLCFKCWPRCRRSFVSTSSGLYPLCWLSFQTNITSCFAAASIWSRHGWRTQCHKQYIREYLMLNIKIRLWSFMFFRLDLFFLLNCFFWFCILNLADPSFFRVRLVVCWPTQWGRSSWAD